MTIKELLIACGFMGHIIDGGYPMEVLHKGDMKFTLYTSSIRKELITYIGSWKRFRFILARQDEDSFVKSSIPDIETNRTPDELAKALVIHGLTGEYIEQF